MRLNRWSGAAVTLAILVGTSNLVAEDKSNDIAKKAVESFNKALNTTKVEDVMKTIHTPYYERGWRDKESTNKALWDGTLRGDRNWKTAKIKVNEVTTLPKLREKEWKGLGEQAEKDFDKLEKILGKDSRMLKVEFQFDDGKWETVIAVRIADGKGTVVGTFN